MVFEPGTRRLRRSRSLAIALLVVCGTAYSTTPRIGAGDFASAQARIVGLVNATGAQIGAAADFKPARTASKLPCYKKVLGYTVKHLEENHAEVPIVMNVVGTADGASLLPRVERYWKSRGYTIDTSGLAVSDRSANPIAGSGTATSSSSDASGASSFFRPAARRRRRSARSSTIRS